MRRLRPWTPRPASASRGLCCWPTAQWIRRAGSGAACSAVSCVSINRIAGGGRSVAKQAVDRSYVGGGGLASGGPLEGHRGLVQETTGDRARDNSNALAVV